MKIACFIAVIYFTMSFQAVAQNVNNPYSIYGIGDIDPHTYNMNAGMGYTGIALKTTYFSNGNNPASTAGMQKNFLVFDVNAVGKTSSYHGSAITSDNINSKDFTIKNAMLSTKVNSLWATGFGFRQFSNVDYLFQKSQQVVGSNDKYAVTYSGDGGLIEYYWNNAFSMGKHFSAGFTASYITGSINQTESILNITSLPIDSKRNDYYRAAKLEYGAIYNTPLSKKWDMSIGVKYNSKTNMSYERTLTVQDSASVFVDEQRLNNVKTALPQAFGVGIAFENKNGVTYAIDYSAQNWNAVNLKGNAWKIVNASRLSGGIEFTSSIKQGLNVIHTKSFQVGAFISNSYLQLNDHNIKEYGVTIGGKRSLKNRMIIGGSLEAGVRGTTGANLIQENYLKLTLSFSFRDFIFSKAYKFN